MGGIVRDGLSGPCPPSFVCNPYSYVKRKSIFNIIVFRSLNKEYCKIIILYCGVCNHCCHNTFSPPTNTILVAAICIYNVYVIS